MKKKEVKKRRSSGNTAKSQQRSSLYDLDSQLGSFGLEPPKIYRQSQTADEQSVNRRMNRNNVPTKSKKTKQQKIGEQNKKRKQKKRLRKLITVAFLLLCIVIVIVVLSLTVLFKIDTIKIQGNAYYTQEQISAVLTIEKEKNLFLADVSSAKEKLEKNLPYIYSAEIKRKFPTTIVVNVKEVKTIYSVKNKDKTYTLLDNNLKVLESGASKRPKGSILIQKISFNESIPGKKAVLANEKSENDLLTMMDAVNRLGLEKEITSIYSSDINSNYMIYDHRITFKLGTTENIDDKLYAALTAAQKLNESNMNVEGEMFISDDKQVYFTEK